MVVVSTIVAIAFLVVVTAVTTDVAITRLVVV